MKNLNFGVIGNCKSAALIDQKGTIAWCCLPDFDSSSVFAQLLDAENGGCFSIEPEGDYRIAQHYIRKTNILVTSFFNDEHAFDVVDFMPRYKAEDGTYHCPPDIIRYLRIVRGHPTVRIHYQPRPAYAQNPVHCETTDAFIKHMTTKGAYESVYLYTSLPFDAVIQSRPIRLENDSFLLLSYNQKLFVPDMNWVELELERTKVYWMGWVAKTKVLSAYQEQVERSSLVLKLLAYQKTGAILAAVTTSLPETIGEVRNWDYRFCWLRDASMTISILSKLGHYNVAARFLEFILNIIPFKDEKIQIMYPINHRRKMTERTLPWLAGYENSRPVRIGNAAAKQKQNDIFGIVLDAIYQSLVIFHAILPNKEELWTVVRTLSRHIEKNWRELDSSIWEFRTEQKHFTFSKIICWVGMDRAARIASFLGRQTDAYAYVKLRDRIKADILKNGCHPETGALTQSYGGRSMDAANLLAKHYGFLSPTDPVYISTVTQTVDELCRDGLMYRYKTADDFGLPKTSFTTCTFWAIKSLYLIGQKDRAREMFEQVLTYSNHLGLYSEDIDFESKRLLGNFPQGYSHISLIDTAITLSGNPDWFDHNDFFLPG